MGLPTKPVMTFMPMAFAAFAASFTSFAAHSFILSPLPFMEEGMKPS